MLNLKEQLDALRALKAEYKAAMEEEHNTCDTARYNFLRKEEHPRLMNLIHDASLDFEAAFFETFGIYPRELIDATYSHGYSLSKKYPIKEYAE
jgi:hypothetical protein